ncbi:MAG TPA: TonB family protein [Steroidobacteraceae bacterium]|nr:TonB family protein [Steroidobacteraceae bacterium]
MSVWAPSDGQDVATATATLKIPQCRLQGTETFFPTEAQLRGIEGEVLLDFLIDERGGTQDVRTLAADPKGVFDAPAYRLVSHWHCAVPGDWKASGAAEHRFRVRVYFKMVRCTADRKCGTEEVPTAEETGVDTYVIVAGSPVQRTGR